jgi:hypothetical protein
MQHFSHEYLEKLIAEHRLVSATAYQLSSSPMYARNHGAAVAGAIDNLKLKRIELEGMIDVLQDYLNG